MLSSKKQIVSYKNHIQSHGVLQLVRSPTRINSRSKTLIDHVYTNIVEDNSNTDCLLFPVSDHLPLITFLKSYNSNQPIIKRKFIRDLKNINYDQFYRDIEQNLSHITPENSNLTANELWNQFENIFNQTFNQHAPIRLQTRKEFKKSFSPWITKAILNSIKTRQKLYKKAIKHSTFTNWNKFKLYRNKLNRTIIQAKQNYFKSEIKKTKSNSQKTWQTMNKIVNLRKNLNNCNKINKINDENGGIAEDPKKNK